MKKLPTKKERNFFFKKKSQKSKSQESEFKKKKKTQKNFSLQLCWAVAVTSRKAYLGSERNLYGVVR